MGVAEVIATKNGGANGQSQTRVVHSSEAREYTVWYAQEFGYQTHMSVTDEMIHGCPDKSRPLAIFPGPNSPPSDYGMLIQDGMRACVNGTKLALYDQIDPSTPDLEEIDLFPNFTPAR